MDRLSVIKGDIVKMKTDAIVNAANTSLLGGGGVDGAIHKSAGPELLEESRKLNGCKTGQAKITKGYKLHAKYIIHTPGPIWRGGKSNEEELLASCYKSCFNIAKENNIKSISFPCISTGVYMFPKEKASYIALSEINEFLKNNPEFEQVNVVCYDNSDLKIYKDALKKLEPHNNVKIT